MSKIFSHVEITDGHNAWEFLVPRYVHDADDIDDIDIIIDDAQNDVEVNVSIYCFGEGESENASEEDLEDIDIDDCDCIEDHSFIIYKEAE